MAGEEGGNREPSLWNRLFGLAFFAIGVYLIYYLIASSHITNPLTIGIWVTLVALCFALAALTFTGKGLKNITLVKIGS